MANTLISFVRPTKKVGITQKQIESYMVECEKLDHEHDELKATVRRLMKENLLLKEQLKRDHFTEDDYRNLLAILLDAHTHHNTTNIDDAAQLKAENKIIFEKISKKLGELQKLRPK